MCRGDSSNVLFLGPQESPVYHWLSGIGESVLQASGKITTKTIIESDIEFIVSYGYRHIIEKPILDLLPKRAINLHISYLPWNKGADPNFWSFVDDTPKGVTIHYIDEGLDTGDILIQKEIKFDASKETLSSSYLVLSEQIEELFQKNWSAIKQGKIQSKKQKGKGTAHKKMDIERYLYLLSEGWETPVNLLKKL